MARGNDKTNVMRILDRMQIEYAAHMYEPDATKSGEEIAAILGEDDSRVFKTLVTRAASGRYCVFVIPVAAGLDLKAAARAAGEKSVAMIRQKDLLPVTGYVHGGCSPFGMKREYPSFIDNSALDGEKIYVSAGKVGFQIELSPADLIKGAKLTLADLTIKS